MGIQVLFANEANITSKEDRRFAECGREQEPHIGHKNVDNRSMKVATVGMWEATRALSTPIGAWRRGRMGGRARMPPGTRVMMLRGLPCTNPD